MRRGSLSCVATLLLAIGHARGQAPELTTRGAVLTDAAGHYSVVMPSGWALDPKSTGVDVSMGDPDGRLSCRLITMDPSPLTVQEQFNLYRQAQGSVYGTVTKVRQRWGTLGGERAGYLESRRTKPAGPTNYAWSVVVVRRTIPHVIDCQTSLDDAEQVRATVTALFGSFRWVEGSGPGPANGQGRAD